MPGFQRQQGRTSQPRGTGPMGGGRGGMGGGGRAGRVGNQQMQEEMDAKNTKVADAGKAAEIAKTTVGAGVNGGAELASATPTTIDDAALATVGTEVLAVVPKDYAEYAASAVPLILKQAALGGVKNADQVAYILATAEHESKFGKPNFERSESLVEDSNPFRVRQGGKNKPNVWSASVHTNDKTVTANSRDDLEKKYWDSAYGGKLGNEKGTGDAANYRGRGFVQITGKDNYNKMSAVLNKEGFTYTYEGKSYGGKDNPIDLSKTPAHVNKVPELAARLLVSGCMNGDYTGEKLGDHVNDKKTDFTGARAVVNGDGEKNGASIATIATRFSKALKKGDGWKKVFEGVKKEAGGNGGVQTA